MDLRTFVAETLQQIVAGVSDAQKFFAENDLAAKLNPTSATQGKGVRTAAPSPVEFDVALTVGSETEGGSATSVGGKMGLLSVVSVKAGMEDSQKSAEHQERVSRVKFSVQLGQPADVHERPPQSNRLNSDW